MHVPLVLASFLAVATVGAWSDSHEFIPATATDARSPCPGLNTLANHGYLPRDGRNFTIDQLMDAALEGFNVNWDPILVAAKFGLLTRDDGGSFDKMSLDALVMHVRDIDLKMLLLKKFCSHNMIEHDASISRNDFGDGTGDNLHFNETAFSALANANPGQDTYDTTAAGQVQSERLAYSIATNPLVINTLKEFRLRSRESALYLSIFGDPLTGVASKKFVQIFFREERLPLQRDGKSPPHSLPLPRSPLWSPPL
ncbi:HEME-HALOPEROXIDASE domain-containing protein [Mycena venus]|uniref:HEME-HALOPEROXIDASE domain-containing protein n=1 Tax=Mycena venus TaxID=2733690 RepID=A0A8H6XPK2_9AGAR|nr:HEME-HALOPEROXIDASE domain-containing protein [Mycena venus]